MTAGLRAVASGAFGASTLHRPDAAIPPGNARSIALARRAGFRREGFPQQVLFTDGAGCGHERRAPPADANERRRGPPVRPLEGSGERVQGSEPEVSLTPDPLTERETDPAFLLESLRGSIDNIDAALIHMLAERFRCTQAVGQLKARHGMPPADPNRESRQVARLRELARDARLDPDFAEKFLSFVIREVIRHHEAIARPDDQVAAKE